MRNIQKLESIGILFGQKAARPYDDRGLNIVEVADLANHPYLNSPIENHIPLAWLDGDWEAELDEDEDIYDAKLGNLFVHKSR